jgi:hypothetical protein
MATAMGTPETLWMEKVRRSTEVLKADFRLKWPGGGTVFRHEAAARCGA